MHRPLDEHVVGGDARLAGVDELAPGDAPGGDVDVGVAADDRRALAAQLQGDRGEVLGCGAHHDPGDVAVARVDDVVEALGEQLGGLGDAAFHDDDGRVGEVGDQRGQRRCGVRGQLTGLEHHCVAGGDRGERRGEQQLHRVVPRGDHGDHAERLRADHRAARLHGHRRGHPVRLGPPLEVGERVGDVGLAEADLGDPRLQRRLAEVGGERAEQRLLVRAEQLVEALQRRPTPGQRLGAPERNARGRRRRCRRSGRSVSSAQATDLP